MTLFCHIYLIYLNHSRRHSTNKKIGGNEMKSLRKIFIVGAVVLLVGATSLTAFAASNYDTPAQAVAGITGRTVESVVEERINSNKTYGAIASEAGKLDEFKSEMLEMKKEILAEQVAEGKISQEEADEIIARIEENQKNCDGTGGARLGRNFGASFGFNGQGLGSGGTNGGNATGRNQNGAGGMGNGGARLRDGSCNIDN